MHTRFWWENQKEPLGKPNVGGRIILRLFLEREWDHMVWIHLAQDKGRWVALANTIMKIQVP
jgi:hypothetical protein